MSTEQQIMNDFADLLKENRELRDRLRRMTEAAQPIANQRDELLLAFEGLVARLELDGRQLTKARALIAKCTQKP